MGLCHVPVGKVGKVLFGVSRLQDLSLLSSRLVLAVRH
jgi:hypothetical protein